MPATYTEQFLARVGSKGVLACTCGREHRLAIAAVLFGAHAIERSIALLGERHGANASVWVLSDVNTEAAAAARWKSLARGARIAARILPGPKPVPSAALVAELAGEVRAAAPDLLVGVGSGVVSDLVKRVSHETSVPNWSVATAASVDAYTSATAAIRIDGYHQAIAARPSEVVVCDLDVLARAPRELFLAGLGDLLAKFLAHLDWTLAHLVAGEPFCEVIAEVALGAARQAMEAARGTAAQGSVGVSGALADAALASGLAMQALGNSRPAATAEHTIAHFWEAVDAATVPEWDLHGILVGAACRLVLPGYRAFHRRVAALRPDVAARAAALAHEPSPLGSLEEGLGPMRTRIANDWRARGPAATDVAERLERLSAVRDRIAELAERLLTELEQAIATLEAIGFPFSLDALGIPPALRLVPVRNVRLLRNRYTSFDLAHDLGEDDSILGPIAQAP